MRNEHPIDLTVTLPSDANTTGQDLRGYLEDDLRTRAEVASADDSSVVVHAYRREEVEAIGDELVRKLTDIGMPDGVHVSWTGDDGERVIRPVEAT